MSLGPAAIRRAARSSRAARSGACDAAFEAWISEAYPLSKEDTYRGGTHWHRQREAFRVGWNAALTARGTT